MIGETNLAPTGAGKGTFSIGNISGAPALRMPVPVASGDAAKAQARMDAAARVGSWVAGNIRYNTRILGGARSEWDAAEDNCRRTPGCRPVPKADGILMTGEEQRKALGLKR